MATSKQITDQALREMIAFAQTERRAFYDHIRTYAGTCLPEAGELMCAGSRMLIQATDDQESFMDRWEAACGAFDAFVTAKAAQLARGV